MGKDLDSLIKEAYVEYFDEAGYPPSSEVWEKTVKELKRKRRAERRKHVRPMIAVFFMIVTITGALAVFNRPVMAFTNRFMKTIIEVTENTFRIHKKIVPIEDKDKEDYFFGRNIEDPRIGEAQKKIHFILLIPEYIPDGYALSSVDVLNKNEDRETVTMLYIKQAENGEKSSFIIKQQSIPQGSELTENISKGEGAEIEDIDIKGLDCTLISDDNGSILLWDEDNISRRIVGIINQEDIIRIAESMK